MGSKKFEEQPASEAVANSERRSAGGVPTGRGATDIGLFGKASLSVANRRERSDPEGTNPEGEAEIRGETGIEGLETGQRGRRR